MQPDSMAESTPSQPWWLGLFLSATAVVLFAIALGGQPNLLDNERRVGAYVLDAVHNGHWLCQRDATGDIASKPPAITWIAAAATLCFEHINRFCIYLPSAAATCAVALVLLAAGRQRFGWRAGFLAALAYLLSPLGDKAVATARYDGLFALPVTLAALAAFHSWNAGRGWTWFWLAATLGMLVKGPLGLILGSAGLLAAFWEKRSGTPHSIRGSHWVGVVLFFAIGGAWFAAAYADMGQPFLDKLLGRELVGHIVKSGRDHRPVEGFYEPPLAFLTTFAPWSLLALVGFWRVWKRPASETVERRFERFLFCWFFVGLVLFSIAAHQRSRLIFPLIPAAALLAGRELDRLLQAWSTRKLLRFAMGATIVVFGLLVIYHSLLLQLSKSVQKTLGMKQMAAQIRGPLGEQFPLTHVDSPFALQFFLNTMRLQVPAERAAELVRGPAAAFLVVEDDYPELLEALGTNAPPLHELARWPKEGPPWVRLVSNHERLEWTDHTVTALGALSIEMQNVKHLRTRGGEMIFERTAPAGAIRFDYRPIPGRDNRPFKVRIRIVGRGPDVVEQRWLAPGENWEKETDSTPAGAR
jgi:4-amino-4-deoxy-L-arabinose transferase-like glycosyltransferase